VLNLRRIVSVVALIGLVTGGVACSSDAKPGSSGNAKTTVTDSGFTLTAGTVTASAASGVAPSGTTVSMQTGAGPLPPEVGNVLTTTGDSMRISLNDGAVQPVSPVKLTFVVDAAAAQDAISKGDAPVVFSRSADGTTELLAGSYDDATHTITATTTHFSSFWPDWFNPSKFFSGVVDSAKQLLGAAHPPPDCVGKLAVSQGVTYTVSSVTGDVAWPCISGDDSQLRLTLYSNSSLVYRVRTTPATSGTPAAELNLTGIAATAIYKELFARYADKESVLPASGSVDFAFDANDPPQDGALLSEPAPAMVAVLVLGLETAGKPFGLGVVSIEVEEARSEDVVVVVVLGKRHGRLDVVVLGVVIHHVRGPGLGFGGPLRTALAPLLRALADGPRGRFAPLHAAEEDDLQPVADPARKRRDRGPGQEHPARDQHQKGEDARAERAEEVVQPGFDPVADLAPFPPEEEHEDQVDPRRDEEEADQVEMALLDAVEQRKSAVRFGDFATFRLGFRFAFGFTGRGAFLSNEHAPRFDAGRLSPVAYWAQEANPL